MDKLGLQRGERASFYAMLKLLAEQCGDGKLVAKARDAYDLASKVIHQDYRPKPAETSQAIRSVREFLFVLERTGISDKEKARMVGELRQA